jgi:hypothetical protein
MVLIAGELDILVPDVDFNEIETFLKDTHDVHENSRTSSEEKGYATRNNRKYPWTRRVLQFNGIDQSPYKNYPEMVKLFEVASALPIDPITRIMIFLYQDNQPDYDFYWHFDGDYTYGFRICVGLDTTKPFVELTKLKTEYEYINNSSSKIEPYMVDESKLYTLYPNKKNTVMLLNRTKYPHRVPIIKSDTPRCVLIVSGVLTDLNLNFLQKIEDEFHTQ